MIQKQDKAKMITGIFLAFLMFFMVMETITEFPSYAASSISVPATVTGDNVYVRTKASRTAAQLTYKDEIVKLSKTKAVTIKGQSIVNGEKWYKISFVLNKKTLTGYMLSDYIKLTLTKTVKGKIITSNKQKVRTKAGKNTYLKVNNQVVTLAKNKAVTIKSETTVSNQKWFCVSFLYNKKTYKGYILANSVTFVATAAAPTASVSTPTQSTEVKASASPSASAVPETKETTGVVTASKLNVRTGAGTAYANLTLNASNVQLSKGAGVTIVSRRDVAGVTWYQVTFTYAGETLKGYVCGSYILLGGTPSPTPSVTTSEPTTTPSASEVPQASVVPLSDKEFEASLTSEGFPKSYKSGLRTLHTKYPLWQFKALKVNYDWDTVIAKETVLGKNLITNSKALGWKSFDTGAYNWSTDKFVPFDGSTWVTASKAAVEYYMDPRNFLTTDGIFQFEYLAYEPQYQTVDGVESILNNTILGDTKYTYTDASGTKQTITYGETFIAAAKYSDVNPFHLATRVKQEVVTSKGLSSSATGTFSGYTGYYNFYNIGATHSTAANGAIINGLTFAKTGNSMSAANKTTFMIPWNSQYNAIVGGAKYIGNNYINRGQNTVYLQKFNLSSYSTFNHQYMANVEAAKAEAQKTYAAYKNFMEIPVVFYIPVFENMPSKACAVPGTVLNPNNWLKTLSVTGCTMTPTFKIANSEDTSYTVMVDSETTSVKINAASVSSLASIDGTGTHTVKQGTNTFKVVVTAQNGEKRTYTIYVIKE